MYRFLFVLMLFALFVSACAGPAAPAEPTEPPATPVPTQEGPIPVDLPPARVAAIEFLAQMLGISTEEIEVVSFEAVDWPDSCLGYQSPVASCLAAITPGFRVILEANGQQYELHTNADGSVIVPRDGLVAPAEAAQQAAVQALAGELGVDPSAIHVVTVSMVEWLNSCLGVEEPGQVCAEVITPGYSILLEANGQQYEYHTNGDLSQVKAAAQQ
jgi:hypothetical protein